MCLHCINRFNIHLIRYMYVYFSTCFVKRTLLYDQENLPVNTRSFDWLQTNIMQQCIKFMSKHCVSVYVYSVFIQGLIIILYVTRLTVRVLILAQPYFSGNRLKLRLSNS